MAIAREEKGLHGGAHSHRQWSKFKRDYSHLPSEVLMRGASPLKSRQQQTGLGAGGGSIGTPGLSRKEELDANPLSAARPAAPASAFASAFASAGARAGTGTAGGAVDEEEADPVHGHPLLFLLARIESAIVAALAPAATLLASLAPHPFGADNAGSGLGLGLGVAKERLLVGTTVFYHRQGSAGNASQSSAYQSSYSQAYGFGYGGGQSAQREDGVYHGVIASVQQGQQPSDPFFLEVLRPSGQRDGCDGTLTSDDVVYLQRPQLDFEPVSNQASSAEEHYHASLQHQHQHQQEAPMDQANDDEADGGARRELASAASSAHLLLLLRFLTNDVANRRLIPRAYSETQGAGVLATLGNGGAAAAVILDLLRSLGSLSWLLLACLRHHLLALRNDALRGPALVEQLNELRDVLVSGDRDQPGSPSGYLHAWFNMGAVRTIADNPRAPLQQSSAGDSHRHELARYRDWVAFRSWLLTDVAHCITHAGASRRIMALVSLPQDDRAAGRRQRKRVEQEEL